MPRARFTYLRFLLRLRRLIRNDHLILAFLALVAGAAGGAAVIAFREAISFVQLVFYGSDSERLFATGHALPWWRILLVPMIGGLVVGLFTHYVMPGRRPQGVADVIEANALRRGWMSSRVGLGAAVISAVSIGSGASVGREGPAVHLGASLSGWLGRRLRLTRTLTRTLLGCGVAAAVAASFNAPIAGALFASEVVIGHYALKAFAPIVIASVAGTAVSRSWFGDFPAFAISEYPLNSFWEFPAFVGLGVVSGVVAIAFMHAIKVSQKAAQASPVPAWLRPAAAGLAVGLLGLQFPEVMGVGYGTTEQALLVALPLGMLLAIAVAKIAATAVSLGWGFGGGVFSPSLVIGAMVGGAYGIVATAVFPEYSSGPGAYTIVGMGAMAAAVLGAPISTTLIVFEMTGDYALTLAVMVAVVIASEITQQLYESSFFALQLKSRGIDLHAGFEAEIMQAVRVGDVMSDTCARVPPDAALPELRRKLLGAGVGKVYVVRQSGEFHGAITLADLSEAGFDPAIDDLVRAGDVVKARPPVLSVTDSLETVLARMSETGDDHMAVVADAETMIFRGCIDRGGVMAAYNRALIESRREERGG